MLKVVQENTESNVDATVHGGSLLDEIVRDGARQMLAAALAAEVATYVEQYAHEVDEHGHAHEHETFILRRARRWIEPAIRSAVDRPKIVLIAAVGTLAIGKAGAINAAANPSYTEGFGPKM